MKYLLLLLFIPAVAQADCGDYPNPLNTPIQSPLEVIFCADLILCTQTTYALNDVVLQEIKKEDALKARLKRYQEIIRKLRRAKK